MDHYQGGSSRAESETSLKRFFLLFAFLAAVITGPAAFSMGEEAEIRLAALLAVMRGDLVRPATPGRKARLLENASILPVMLRAVGAAQEEVAAARRLYDLIQENDRSRAATVLRHLMQARPFHSPPLAVPLPRALVLGQAIHREACAGCHDAQATDAFLPAENLFRLACEEPPPLLEARILLGVKGMAAEGHRNPFSPAEQAALAAWYRKGATAACPGPRSSPLRAGP